VRDEQDGRANPAHHVAQVGGVSRDAAQGVGDGDCLEATGLQLLDDGDPARGLCEGAVDQRDGWLLL
jgi:hypothetical protein